MNLLIEECKRRFPNNTIGLEVRSFNKRAINCYRNVGFKIKEKYIKKTFDNSVDEFYYMELLSKPAVGGIIEKSISGIDYILV